MSKRYIKLSRRDDETGDNYYWGKYCIDNNSDIFSLMASVWDFGCAKRNFHAELITEEDEEE